VSFAITLLAKPILILIWPLFEHFSKGMSETTKRKAAGRDADSLDSKKRKVEPQVRLLRSVLPAALLINTCRKKRSQKSRVTKVKKMKAVARSQNPPLRAVRVRRMKMTD